MSLRACIHLSLSRIAFVNISALIWRVGHLSRMNSPRENCSCNHAKHRPCVRCICLIVGFLPVPITLIAVSLSSLNIAESFLFPSPKTRSHNCNAGSPIVLTATSAETISASGVECDLAVCFLLSAAKGKKVFLPLKQRKQPEVDTNVGFSAQFASA